MALPSTADLIVSALQKLGVVNVGETAAAPEDALIGLAEFNALIGQWGTNRRLGAYERRESFTFTTARASYSIGNSADSPNFAVSSGGRPYDIEHANVIDTSVTPNLRIPLRKMKDEEFSTLSLPEIVSTFPTAFNYKPSYPNGTIYPYPAYPSNTTWKFEAFWWDQLDRVTLANINAALSLAPGAEAALVLTLTERLYLTYPGRDNIAEIKAQAREARADFMTWNTKPPNLTVDPLGTSSPSGFNHLTRRPA